MKERYGQCPIYMKLDHDAKQAVEIVEQAFCDISCMIQRISKKKQEKLHVISLCNYFLVNDKECQSILSYSMIRKILSLLNSQYIDCKGHLKILKTMRSLGEYICIDFILRHKNPQQLRDNFRSAINLRDGQFIASGLIFFLFFNYFLLILFIVY